MASSGDPYGDGGGNIESRSMFFDGELMMVGDAIRISANSRMGEQDGPGVDVRGGGVFEHGGVARERLAASRNTSPNSRRLRTPAATLSTSAHVEDVPPREKSDNACFSTRSSSDVGCWPVTTGDVTET